VQFHGTSNDDGRLALTAATVRDLIYVCAAWDLVRILAVLPFSANLPAALAVLTVKALLVEVVPYLLLRRGRVKQAAWTLSLSALVIAALFVTISGGIRSSAVAIQVGMLAVVGLLYGRRTALALTACVLAFLSVLALLYARGIALPAVFPDSQWAAYTNFLSSATIALVPGLRVMTRIAEEREMLRGAQRALRESEMLYRGISDNSPVGVFRTNARGEAIYANPRMLEIWAMDWAAFRDRGFVARIHPEDAVSVLAVIAAAHAEQRECSNQYRLACPGGVRWVTGRASPVFDANGRYDGEVGTVVDTTDAVNLNSLLREKEAYMRTILDSEPECVKTISQDGLLVEMNPAGLAMIEAGCEAEVVGRSVMDLVAAEHRQEFAELHRNVLAGKSGMMEYKMTGLQGTVRWLETHSAPLRNSAGEVIAAVAVSRDISDRKARDETQRRLSLIQAAAHIGLWDRAPDGSGMWVNAENLRMFDFAEDSAPVSADFWERIHPEERDSLRRSLEAALAGGPDFEAEYRVVWRDGSEHWVMSKAEVIRDAAGNALRIVGVNQDITARKQREQALQESEENFRILFDRAPYGVVLTDVSDFSIAGFNSQAHEQLGFSREEFARLNLWDFEAGMNKQQILEAGESARRNPPAEFETKHRAKDGRIRDVLVTTAPVRIAGRALIYSAVQDITERKRAERELSASEARQRILAELSSTFWAQQNDPIAVLRSSVRKLEEGFADLCAVRLLSVDGSFLEPSLAAFGVSMDFSSVRSLLAIPLPMDGPYFHQQVLRTGSGKFIPLFDPAVWASEFGPAHQAVTQSMGAHSMMAVPLRAGDRPIGVLTVTRHRAEQPSFQEQDFAFVQELADRAALAYSAAKLNVDLQAELVQRRTMESERELMLAELQQLAKHLETTREDERSRIAREIHDELGQQLTGLKMRFDFLFRAPLTPAQFEEQKQSMNTDLEAAIRTVRTIAAELRPGVLDSLGPAAALEWLARDFQVKFGIPCETSIQTFPAEDSAGTTLFRVAQEALTNVARHASASNVWLRCYPHGDSVWLEVVDDGVGIREEDLRKNERFGLIGMRERAALAGGSLSVTRGESGGTQLMLRLPALDKELHHAIPNRG
jgi:PAS domain S-box-containing protein